MEHTRESVHFQRHRSSDRTRRRQVRAARVAALTLTAAITAMVTTIGFAGAASAVTVAEAAGPPVSGRDWGLLFLACGLTIVGSTARRLRRRRAWTAEPTAYATHLRAVGSDGRTPEPMDPQEFPETVTQPIRRVA